MKEDFILEKELKSAHLPPLEIQYQDFAVWQRQLIESKKEELLTYWKNKLADISPLQMPTDYSRPINLGYKGASVAFTLPNELKVLSEEYSATHYTTLLTGLAITLFYYTGQNDVIIGTPFANRQHPQLENLIGFFVNRLVLRIQLNLNHTLQECISQIQGDLVEAQLYQDMPFEKLVDELGVERDTSRHPLFQVVYMAQYSDSDATNEDTSDKDERVLFDNETAKCDLSIALRITPNHIKGRINYATSLFKQDTIERFITHYQQILQAMLRYKEKAIGTYPILTPAEYQQIVIDWNKTDKNYPRDKTIHQLFEEQVKRTPHHIALVFEDRQLTYEMLNTQANQFAYYLHRNYPQHAKSDALIAVCMNRSCEMIIALLGILKAGFAYVPISPNYPQERIQHILNDSAPGLLITQIDLLVYIQGAVQSDILIFDFLSYQQEPTDDLSCYISPV